MTSEPTIWMPIYWSDWMKDTGMLSLQEQGAYFMLLKEYWNNCGPIKDDKTRIYRSCGAQTRSEKESINLILETYFLHDNGVYKHNRINKVLTEAIENKQNKKERAEMINEAIKEKGIKVKEERWWELVTELYHMQVRSSIDVMANILVN